MMKAIGLVMLYDRRLGAPGKVSTEFNEFFPQVTENLVKEDLMELPELKEILDAKRIFWGGIKENFKEMLANEQSIGKLAWQVFHSHTDEEASDEVKSLIYDGSQAPWEFTIAVCVLYE